MDKNVSRAVEIIESKKAENVKVYDVKGKSPFMDYVVICTGTSSTNMDAIVTELRKELPAYRAIEGTSESQWILADFGDFIVNVFSREKRAYYNLDGIFDTSEDSGEEGKELSENMSELSESLEDTVMDSL